MLTPEQKETVREAYAAAIAWKFPQYSADELITDIYPGGEDPGQWGTEDTAVTILTEMRGVPSPVDMFDWSDLGGGGTHYYSDDWVKIDEHVRASTGLEVYSEPVNAAVVNVWEICPRCAAP